MTKKCADCKHHYFDDIFVDYRCMSPRIRHMGWSNSPLPTYSNSTIFQRMSAWPSESICGYSGEWFEPKPPTEDAREKEEK